MKTTELAKLLGVSGMTVRRMVKDGRIPPGMAATTSGGHHHFPITPALSEWIKSEAKAAAKRSKGYQKITEIRHQMRGIRAPMTNPKSMFYPSDVSSRLARVRRVFNYAASLMIDAAEAMNSRVKASQWPQTDVDQLLKELDRVSYLEAHLSGLVQKKK